MPGTGEGPQHTVQEAVAKYRSQVIQVGNYYAGAELPPVQAPVSLPPLPQPLVGRDVQAQELLTLLDAGHADGQRTTAVIAVTGLPGVGKTALALHAAHHARDAERWFDGGVLYADLRGYNASGKLTSDQVLSRWLRDLGTRDADMPATAEERLDRYRSLLYRLAEDGQRVLLVADNASSVEQVQPLIPPRAEHRLLITSRDSLVSLPARQLAIVQLDRDPAAELIAERLRRVRPDDARPATETVALACLAARCGGLPIALEIVAQLLAGDPGLPIAHVAEAVAAEQAGDDRNAGLLGAAYDAFGLSYQRLVPEAARTFRLLALNAGPGIATAAVAALVDQPVDRTRELLAVLAQASLVTEQQLGSGWWVMHDLVHAYAADCAARDCTGPERDSALDRVLVHYARTAFDAYETLRLLDSGPDQAVSERFQDRATAFAWFDRERDNLIATVSRTAESVQPTSSEAGAAHLYLSCTLALMLGQYLPLRFLFDELLAVSEAALRMARRLDDASLEGRALDSFGDAQLRLGQLEAAHATFQQVAQLAWDQGDRGLEADALLSIGITLARMRRFDEAFAAYDRSKAVYRDLGDLSGEASVLNSIGVAQNAMRSPEEAAAAYRDAVALCRQSGNRRMEAAMLVNLSGVLPILGHLQESVDTGNAALAIYQELGGDSSKEAEAWHNIGTAIRRSKEFKRTGAPAFVLQRAVTAYRNAGDEHGTAEGLNSLGIALAQTWRFRRQAVAAYQEATDLFYKTHDRHSAARTLAALSIALRKLRRFEEAIDAARRSADEYQAAGDSAGEVDALVLLGVALARVRRFDGATAAFTRSRDKSRSIGDNHHEEIANSLIAAAQKKQRWRILLAATTIYV